MLNTSEEAETIITPVRNGLIFSQTCIIYALISTFVLALDLHKYALKHRLHQIGSNFICIIVSIALPCTVLWR